MSTPDAIQDLDQRLDQMIRDLESGDPPPDVPLNERIEIAEQVAAELEPVPGLPEAQQESADVPYPAPDLVRSVVEEPGLSTAPEAETHPATWGHDQPPALTDADAFADPRELFADDDPEIDGYSSRLHLGRIQDAAATPEPEPPPAPAESVPPAQPALRATTPPPAPPSAKPCDANLEPPGGVDRWRALQRRAKRAARAVHRPLHGPGASGDPVPASQRLIGYAALALIVPGLLLTVAGLARWWW